MSLRGDLIKELTWKRTISEAVLLSRRAKPRSVRCWHPILSKHQWSTRASGSYEDGHLTGACYPRARGRVAGVGPYPADSGWSLQHAPCDRHRMGSRTLRGAGVRSADEPGSQPCQMAVRGSGERGPHRPWRAVRSPPTRSGSGRSMLGRIMGDTRTRRTVESRP